VSEVTYVEITGRSRNTWLALPSFSRQKNVRARDRVLEVLYVERFNFNRVYIKSGYSQAQIEADLRAHLKRILQDEPELSFHTKPESFNDALMEVLKDRSAFASLDFGKDVAEHDANLANYFISTKAYQQALSGDKNLIIGPKGSGKSAIMLELSKERIAGYSIKITPEVFATSMLQRFTADGEGVWDEEQAFVSTWIFTILVEVFRTVCGTHRGKDKALSRIRNFLQQHSEYNDVDLFTRFITRLSRIQAIKVGNYEIAIKTKELQRLYALDDVYALIPDLRKALNDDILVLLDELDTGWDNTEHANRFVASLMQAAIRVQALGLRIRVVAFLRSEIFDLVKHSLDHLDKLRSSIERLHWDIHSLSLLVLKRVAFSFQVPGQNIDPASVKLLFPQSCGAMSGFEYLVSRTTRRPREILQFARLTHENALNQQLTVMARGALLQAEEQFSQWKIEHVCSEYKFIYPAMERLLGEFRGRGPILSREEVLNLIQQCIDDWPGEVPLWIANGPDELVQRLYDIEFLGIERKNKRPGIHGILRGFEFAYEHPAGQLGRVSAFLVHPAFWSALEISNYSEDAPQSC
jgi:hypothetical protein